MTRPTTTGKAQDLITFTRSTTGTALAKISYGEELVTNGTFDDDLTGWTTGSNVTSVYYSGAAQLTLGGAITSTGANWFSQNVFETGKLYFVTFDATYVSGGSLQAGYGFNLEVTASSSGTYSFIVNPDIGAGGLVHREQITFAGASGAVWRIDNVSVKEVLYDQPDGTLQLFNHPINKPRIEYDASGNCLGLLVEEARTNIISTSEALLVASNRVIAESSVSPTREQTAQTWRVNGSASASPYWYGSANIVSGTTYTCSVFVRLPTSGPTVESRYIRLSSQSTIQGGAAIFDLQEGTVVSSNMLSESITPVGNGWYRISVTNIAASSGVSFSFILWPIINAAGNLYVNSASDDGKALFETFGMQTEAGSFPTSYIPTSGSAVTRAADIASLAVSEFGYNQDQFSVVVESDLFGGTTLSTLCYIGENTSNRILFYYASRNLSYQIKSSSAIRASKSLSGRRNKAAYRYKLNDMNLAGNGDTTVADTSANLINGTPNNIYIGSYYNGSNLLNGHIKSIQYYPLGLSNAQLQALTV